MSEHPYAPDAEDAPPPIDLATVRSHKHLHDNLAQSKEGVVLPTVSNILAILRHDPALTGIVTLNEFTHETAITRAPPLPDDTARPMPGPYPRPWTGADEALILAYIQRNWTSRATDSALAAAMTAESAMRGFHPVRDYLDSLKWDGTHRLDQWLQTAFGALDSAYTRDIGAKTLIAAVRRIRQPGCKFDFMLILEGPQGIGKSTAVQTLFSVPWFSDTINHDLGHKDAAIGLVGVWGLELAEIAQFIRNDVETIKAFLGRTTDKYRPPYGRTDVTRPRQGVVVGTTNKDDYLRDDTGNRRFWPFRCTRADVEWISLNRDQLWAEASAREDAGEPTYLENPDVQAEAAEAQANRMLEDDWHGKIADYIQAFKTTTTSAVLEYCIQMPVKDHNRSAQMRAGAILTTLGWVKVVGWKSGKTARWWERAPSRS